VHFDRLRLVRGPRRADTFTAREIVAEIVTNVVLEAIEAPFTMH